MGMLYICGTPIGNLEDMTYRGVRTLQEVDLILAEDTRNTIKLLNHFEIKTPMISYNEHNKGSKIAKIIKTLKEGQDVALVSDAGMPCISDPGEDLIKECYIRGVKVTTVPTGTAVVSALILSGLNMRSYTFQGFLPRDKKMRKKVLETIKEDVKTTIFYEAPHHIKSTLKQLETYVGNREVSIVREITKKYEEVKVGKIEHLIKWCDEKEPRGEMCIVIEGTTFEDLKHKEVEKWEKSTIDEHMEFYLSKGNSQKESMKLVAKDRGVSKRDIYSYLNNR